MLCRLIVKIGINAIDPSQRLLLPSYCCLVQQAMTLSHVTRCEKYISRHKIDKT